MKKLIAFLSAGLMLVAVAAPALAGCHPCRPHRPGVCCPSVEINNSNRANVVTTADSNSNTGGNSQVDTAMFSMSSDRIVTGDAYSDAWAVSNVNSNVNTVRVGRLMGPIEVNNSNGAWVRTRSSADSNTGRNSQVNVSGFSCGTDTTRTGSAVSWSAADSFVNSNETTVRSWGAWIW